MKFFKGIMLFSLLFNVEYLFAQPAITSFLPISGKVGDTITISGTNFNSTTANNIVFFGATRAKVTTASTTSLTVTVPIGAMYAPITILDSATGLSANSTQFFNLTFSPNKGSFGNLDVAPHSDFLGGYLLHNIDVGDLNGDGRPDVVCVNINSNLISVLTNTSNSGLVSFATKIEFTTSAGPINVKCGDLDGDGKLDLAVVNYNTSIVSVYRNISSNGIINFATMVDFTTGLSPRSVAIGDINGDGKLDLSVANFGSNTVSVLRNTSSIGSISFATKVDFATGSGPYSIAIGDIDGNGKPDLAVTNDYDSSVSVLRNTSSTTAITFATRVNFATGLYPEFVIVCDLNGDNKLDMAVANCSNSNSVSILRNTSSNGTISFAGKVDFTMTSFPNSIGAGDIDGDGKPDLAVCGGDKVSVIRNTSSNGTISFATRVDFISGYYAKTVAICDLDGDGKPDLNVGNRNSSTVAVFRNKPFYPPPTILSYAPASGPVGTVVNITGTLFNPLPANNVVFFGATRALVSTATDTSLTVIVPAGATYAPITVLNTGTNSVAYSTKFFKPTFSPNLGIITTADFAPKVDFTTELAPKSVVIGDIDGDGMADLITANENTNTVSILRNTSTNGVVSYASKLDFATGLTQISLAIGDLDGDGKLDLAVLNQNSSFSILRNTSSNGIISFAPKVDFATGFSPYSLAIGDMDSDGKPDLVVVNASPTNVSVFLNTCTVGSVNFATMVDFGIDSSPSSVAIGDLNEDGKPDLAVAIASSNKVSVLRNTSSIGTLNFAPMINYSVGVNPKSIAMGDLNGDGKFDLAIANRNSATVSLLRNISSNGNISFAPKEDFVTGTNPNQVAIGDMDGNGSLDLVIANDGGNSLSILQNTTSSVYFSFAPKVNFTTGSSPKSVAIGDLTGDGKPDLVTANYTSNTVSVIRNYPKYIPTITSFTPTSGPIGTLVSLKGSLFNPTISKNIVFFGATRASVNSATDTSLVVTVPPGASFSQISELNTDSNLVGFSSGIFNPTYSPNKAMVYPSDFSNKLDFATGLRPESVVVGDIDGDGKPDMALVNDSSNTVSILLNTGNSSTISFANKLDFVAGLSPTSLAIGDIDRDGKLDLAISNYDSNTVSIYKNTSNTGTISFATKVDFITGINPRSVIIGDFDMDGKPDLVVANEGSGNVSILRNIGFNGIISFAEKLDLTVGANPKSLTLGDFDKDGRSDLAITNYNSNTISIFRNTGNFGMIGFAPKIDLTTGSNPISIATGDLDGNGSSEIVVNNYNSGNVSIFRNTSNIDSISFASKMDFATGFSPRSVAIGDLDGNGKPDLAIANSSSSVTVLVNISNNGTINFATKVDFGTGLEPYSIAIGDLDVDGKLDLAIANRNSNTVSVLRNNPQPPPSISLFYPTNGKVGDTISISGINFNNNPAYNIVFFGATRANVLSSNDTNLIVRVPIGSTYAPINVLNTGTGYSAYSKQFFNPIFSPNRGNIATTDFDNRVDFGTGTVPKSVAIGDLDGDGKPDLAIANGTANTVSIFRNTGSSGIVSFATKVDFATGLFPESVAIGDINGDGKPDLLIANGSSQSVSVLSNTSTLGLISFNAKIDFGGLSGNPTRIAVGDLDSDGKPDLAITIFHENKVSVLRNIGSSGLVDFAPKIDFSTGSSPFVVNIGDLNGDGKPDLAIGNSSEGSISLFRNISTIGTINFAPRVSYSAGQSPYALAIGDLDVDGKLDIAVASFITETVYTFRNTSSGNSFSFTPTVYSVFNSNPKAMAIGDLNGDGKPEVVITDGGAYVSIMRNASVSGTITLAQRVNLGVSSSPGSLAIGDLDGDGKSDLVVNNESTNLVSVYRNNPQTSPSINITSNFNHLNTCSGVASVPLFFTIGGVSLTSNIIVTASPGFEVSTNANSVFLNSVTLTQTSGNVNNTTVFVRLKNSATGSPIGNIVCTSTGAITKNLTITSFIKPSSTNITNVSICPTGLPYIWSGRTYNSSQIDTIFLTNSVGCDSFNVLKLTVNSNNTSTSNINICPKQLPYTWNSRTYNSSTTDTIHLLSTLGCDSITILKLLVSPAVTSTNSISICPSSVPYSWNGRTYNSNSIDTVYLTNSVGCDSITILNLTIKPTKISTSNLSICQSSLPYSWNGLTFNSAGTQTKTGLTNVEGCDSSATLNLTVNPSPNTSNIVGLTNASELDTTSYSVNGLSGSVFNWLISGGTIQSGAGSNQIQVKWLTKGIDTIKVTETSNLGCTGAQKSLVVNVSSSTGMNELKLSNQVIIYPNPFSETIHISFLNNLKLEKVVIYDLLGNEIINSNNSEIDGRGLKSGVYLIMVMDSNGISYSQKLIKN